MIRPRALLVAAAIAAAPACDGDDGGEAAAVVAEVAPPPARAAPEAEDAGDGEIRYDDSIAGLEKLVRDLQAALAAGDDAAAARLFASLRLPDYQAWFSATFGERVGQRVADEYRGHHDDIGLLAEVLRDKLGASSVAIRAERFERADDPAATGYQSAALGAMKAREPLYSVRLAAGDDLFHLWSFVHEGGTFRYVGKLTATADEKPPRRGRDPLEYRQRDADKVAAGRAAR